MWVVDTYAMAVAGCLVTMLCWGSWANTQKLASTSWRFELFYWDYVWGILLFSLLLAFTAGSNGTEGRSFTDDLAQATRPNLLSAFWGGIVFNVANIVLVAAIAIAGMSVAFPVGIGIALVLGVIVNYLDRPEGQPGLLFGGVALVSMAIWLNARAYRSLAGRTGGVSARGLLLSVVAGVAMGFFYKYVAAAMATDFAHPEAGKLTPYTALVLFALGIAASNMLINTYLIYKPVTGAPSSYAAYFRGSGRDHLMGIFGGMIWTLGMALSILASDKAGPAISYGLGQGATIVAAIWGIYIWKEFREAPPSTGRLLKVMLLLYAVGLGLLIAARL
ncbi:GRP family sugar transporter [Siphonobacter aquaeclarae]|uniref:Glucose uptake protein n=1 Tax=Siphonobacter aquaeclarae TaxID=563176 RepID=A0A1G9S2Q8_9BACT|nr:GRP family sugar transporter [Siphonobacter aquaeclarae]SDM29702.1 glucose uptake protein [Siphonobacter aquaeclarae]